LIRLRPPPPPLPMACSRSHEQREGRSLSFFSLLSLRLSKSSLQGRHPARLPSRSRENRFRPSPG
jgi:hypothetical protein